MWVYQDFSNSTSPWWFWSISIATWDSNLKRWQKNFVRIHLRWCLSSWLEPDIRRLLSRSTIFLLHLGPRLSPRRRLLDIILLSPCCHFYNLSRNPYPLYRRGTGDMNHVIFDDFHVSWFYFLPSLGKFASHILGVRQWFVSSTIYTIWHARSLRS